MSSSPEIGEAALRIQMPPAERSEEDRARLCNNEHVQPAEEATSNVIAINVPEPSTSNAVTVDCSSDESHVPPPPYSEIPGTVPLHSGRTSGPPPSYDDVINPDAPPPTYQSLFGQVRQARKTSRGFLDFLRKLILILLGTLGVTILIGFTVLIPVTMVMVGASHMNDCPAENIPTFLLVGGLVWVLKNILNFYSTCRKNLSDPALEADIQARHRRHESLLNCFLFGWFIAGCVLVYRIYPPDFEDTTSENYCNRTVYLYAFWLVTSTFIIFGLFMACLCCLTISSVLAAQDQEAETSS